MGPPQICGTTHKTVKRVVERARGRRRRAGRVDRGHNYERCPGVGRRAGDEDARAGSARSGCCRAARAAGYAGSARNFRRLVAQAEGDVARETISRGRRPAVWTPGEHLVIDWGVQDGLHVFCAVLAWSRVRFVRFAADEKAATTLALLAECFEALGGVPKVVLADRMGCLKGGRGRQRGGPDRGLRPVRHALPVPAGLLPRRRPGVARASWRTWSATPSAT